MVIRDEVNSPAEEIVSMHKKSSPNQSITKSHVRSRESGVGKQLSKSKITKAIHDSQDSSNLNKMLGIKKQVTIDSQ